MVRVRYSFSSRHTGNIANIKKQRPKFPKLVLEVIKISDIILEVLDARFLEDTRNLEVEDEIRNAGKKIIYVLNKSDLVDKNKIKRKAEEFGIYPYVLISCTKRQGSRQLRERIKIEASRVETTYDRIQVGIIGYPNTGKSSLINLLTGKTSAAVGAEAGFTKGMQKIRLTADIMIIDTPGVIPSDSYSGKEEDIAKHAKVGARTYDKVKDPEFSVLKLFEKYSKQIESFYKINSDSNVETFLNELGKKRNFLKKGNEIDMDRTARIVLKDWQLGNIKI